MTETTTIAQRQAAVIEQFAVLGDDHEERFREVIDAGRGLEPYPEAQRDEQHKIKGCQSQAWMHAALEDGRVHLWADSDAHIVRGLLALIVRVYSGATPDEIIATPPDFIDAIGLNRSLSQNRAFGLQAAIKQAKLYALVLRSR